MKFLFLVLLVFSANAFAGGDGHSSGHASDLIPAFVNISLLATLLIWKLKDPVKNYFEKKSNDVSEVLERANVKAKQAEMMMKMQEEKSKGLEIELSKIQKDTKSIIEKYRSDYALEVTDRIKKLKEDAVQKIEAEKNQMIDQVNGLLLDEVISKSKTKIKNSIDTNAKITENILQDLK